LIERCRRTVVLRRLVRCVDNGVTNHTDINAERGHRKAMRRRADPLHQQ
jgi:hypothetical protein